MRVRACRPATWIVVIIGAALRVGLGVVLPPERAYDDHLAPVRIILKEHRLPSAADCWECFQPPLYYVLSAGVYSAGESAALAAGAQPQFAERVGRKAMQFISVAAGIATLWACVLVLRRACNPSPGREALALGVVAFLPRHLYMSAMVTNDALAYLLATLAVYAALWAHAAGWSVRGCLTTGALAGAAALCKGYGLVTVLAILVSMWVGVLLATRGMPKREYYRRLKPFAVVLGAALAVGVWPTVRNLAIYDRVHVDNYDIYDTPMYYQPPGSIRATSFLSFRLPALLRHPWIHMAHVDSFWTELYARMWFDYEGFSTVLSGYPPWEEHFKRCEQAEPEFRRRRHELLLSYTADAVPPAFRPVAIAGYLAGLPLAVAVLGGLFVGLRRLGREFSAALLRVHFVGSLAVPLVHTLRLPHFAAMKAAFALGGLASVPVLVFATLSRLGRYERAAVAVLWAALVALLLANGAYVALLARQLAAIGTA